MGKLLALGLLYSPDLLAYDTYFQNYDGEVVGRFGGCHPDTLPTVSVESVEKWVREVLKYECLGAPLLANLCVRDALEGLIAGNCYHVFGPAISGWNKVSAEIADSFSRTSRAPPRLLSSPLSPSRHPLGTRPSSILLGMLACVVEYHSHTHSVKV